MILLDTGPLVALCDPRDGLNARALCDLGRLTRGPLVVCDPVMVEACFHLPHATQRERLRRFLTAFVVQPYSDAHQLDLWAEIFDWLTRYRDHEPDWADGYLAVVSAREKRSKVWTYDREFRILWKRPDGRRIPLAFPVES
ncbi:MAG TPA: type II toxin-antitoxin system VapC family toxin [Polyangiaceae bacterium]